MFSSKHELKAPRTNGKVICHDDSLHGLFSHLFDLHSLITKHGLDNDTFFMPSCF